MTGRNSAGRCVAIVAAIMAWMPLAAWAQKADVYPSRPVTIVNPYPPGGSTDPEVRMYAQKLNENLGVPFLVDACQAVGQLPVDVKALQCDYLSTTARKWLRGPRGIGFLYVSDEAIARGDAPLHVDMRGATWTTRNGLTLTPDARRFEEWEHSWINVLGLGAAARYALDVGLEVARDRARHFARELRAWAEHTDGLTPLDRGHDLSAIVTLEIAGHEAAPIVMALRRERVHTSATLQWYGLADLGPRGVESAIRVSPHYFNTDDEIKRFQESLLRMMEEG